MRMARLLSLAVVTMSLCTSVPVGAQQPVAPPPPQIPYGVPISLEQAKKVMAGAEAEAKPRRRESDAPWARQLLSTRRQATVSRRSCHSLR
jgi:hypothetical protein